MPTDVFNPNLLGGQYTTRAELEANQQALANRRAGLEAGFAGGDQWGEGRYGQFMAGARDRAMSDRDRGLMLNPIMGRFDVQDVDLTGVLQGQERLDLGQLGLYEGQETLNLGQQYLGEGQLGLATGQLGLATGQEGLLMNQVNLAEGQTGLMSGQQVLGEGQQTIGQAVGRGLDLMGQPLEQQPQTLFAGQADLSQGQQQIGGGVGNFSDFQKAVQAYQQKAQGEREEGLKTGVSGRDVIGQQVGNVGEQLTGQVRDVGLQANRVAERQANMSNQNYAQRQSIRADQIANNMGRNFSSPSSQQSLMGPTGPVAIDPRDLVRFGPTGSPV